MEDTPDFMVSEALERVDDDREMLQELTEMLFADAPTQVSQLKAAAERGDSETIEHVAHSMKSALGNLGASAAASVCLTLEKLGRAKSTENAQGLIADLEQKLDSFQRLTAKFFAEG
jgi:HPt (histidine-containing phosphotransfer) domain-containing protein